MRIFYRLTTADGIKSDIRETDHFTPLLRTAITPKITKAWADLKTSEMTAALDLNMCRIYSVKSENTVHFIEYEEDK